MLSTDDLKSSGRSASSDRAQGEDASGGRGGEEATETDGGVPTGESTVTGEVLPTVLQETVTSFSGNTHVLDEVSGMAATTVASEVLHPIHHRDGSQQRPPPEQAAPTPLASNTWSGERTARGGDCVDGPSNCGGATVSPAVAGGDTPEDEATGFPTILVPVSGQTEVGIPRVRETRVALNAGQGGGVASLKKDDLLQRSIDVSISEPWAACDRCGQWGHQASSVSFGAASSSEEYLFPYRYEAHYCGGVANDVQYKGRTSTTHGYRATRSSRHFVFAQCTRRCSFDCLRTWQQHSPLVSRNLNIKTSIFARGATKKPLMYNNSLR